jgi:arylsulfate sulfotransferase
MRNFLVLAALASLVACGDGGGTSVTAVPSPASADLKTNAQASDIVWTGSEPGITPFIAFVQLSGQNVSLIQTVSYVIEPRPGSVSKPVRVTYTLESLRNRGRVAADGLTLPVFGLYAGYSNAVSIELNFGDCSVKNLAGTVTTASYTDPNGVYDRPVFIKNRTAGSALGFDFFAMKSGLGTPIIVDTDGAIRWVGVGNVNSISSAFTDNGFVVGDQRSTRLWRLELDGTETAGPAAPANYRNFHHNIDAGKTGLLAEFDTPTHRESTIAEFTFSAGYFKQWDFAALVTDHMIAGGDDPSLFVRPSVDWFHTNAAIYDARDDSLVVSSRENFVMNVDYDTGAIRWLLGDPTKYWYQFPSLRAKAVTLAGGGLFPVGQHSLSITRDGLLLTFNAGNGSENQPAGAPRGEQRTYSAVSAYRIDAETRTATEVWNFDYGQTLYSDHCSSVYEGPEQSILISFARVDNRTHARLVGLNALHEVVFDFQYEARGCNASWNAVPVPLENMSFL